MLAAASTDDKENHSCRPQSSCKIAFKGYRKSRNLLHHPPSFIETVLMVHSVCVVRRSGSMRL